MEFIIFNSTSKETKCKLNFFVQGKDLDEIVEWLTYRIQDTDRATYLHLIESQKVSIVL